LLKVNPGGDLLIDFVIDSGDDRNLIAFLMPNLSNSETLVNKKYFLKMQSEQYLEKQGKTLFEHYLYIKDNETRDEFFELCFYLLEESNVFVDIKKETCIEVALVLANIDKYRNADEKSLTNDPEKDLILTILNSKEGKEILEAIKDKDAKYDHEYDCDKILKYFSAYWSTNDTNFEKFMKRLKDHSPFFEMITYILEGKQEEFVNNFHFLVNELVKSYNARYKKLDKNEKTLQKDLFILFRTAIKNNQKRVMDCILDFESFENLKFSFPRYKKANENNHHAALKLLDHGYALGHERIPDDWINEQVMTEFIDKQIEVLDQDMIRMNTNFLLDPYDRKFKIKSKEDVDDQMLFWEYNCSLEFIVESETLKDMILHPVLSTYINLKSYKYQRVYEWNFFLFFFMYLLPFGLLITYHSFDNLNKTLLAYYLRALETLCITSTSLLTIREFAQMVWISKTWKEYFGKISNWLELTMLLLSWILLMAICYLNIDEHLEYFAFLSTVLIMLSTIELLTMLPFPSMPLYMMMLKKVTATFLKFFCFFAFILFSFSISFCVIFRPNNVTSIGETLDTESTTTTPEAPQTNEEEPEEVYKNFESLAGSFFKTVMMLSGEFTIEPFSLSPTRMIIFFFFVLSSFVLFNLILGLAIDDVQRLREEAEVLTLRYEAKKFINSAAKWFDLYRNFE
jgi:Ion transport protein